MQAIYANCLRRRVIATVYKIYYAIRVCLCSINKMISTSVVKLRSRKLLNKINHMLNYMLYIQYLTLTMQMF